MARGADRPDDDSGKKGRRFGRGRPEQPAVPEEIPQEETGWLDDLRSAKQEQTAIGPGTAPGEARTSKSGRRAPGPDDDFGDDSLPGFGGGDAAPGFGGDAPDREVRHARLAIQVHIGHRPKPDHDGVE